MQFAPLILLAVVALIIYGLVKKRSKDNKNVADLQNEAVTYEDKMLLLQKETNKRLRDIDTTLDWFFWIMVFSFLIYIIYVFATQF